MRYVNGIVVVCVLFFFIPIAALAQSLDDPGAPGSNASKMYTLENIYQRLSDNTQASDPQTGSFTEPGSGPTGGTGHTLNDVYGKAIPTQVPKTGQTVSDATGDDGDLEKGVSWPSPSTRWTCYDATPAVVNCSTGSPVTAVDNLTGLQWTINANLPPGEKTWSVALTYCNELSLGGYSDWRLPNRYELESLLDMSQTSPALPSGNPFTSVQSYYYWTSTTYAANTYYAWYVGLDYGSVYQGVKTPGSGGFYVWPVRAGQ